MLNKILITGTSSGIGNEFAELLKKEEIISSEGVDLANLKETKEFCAKMIEQDLIPDIIINNAGVNTHGYYHQLSWEEEEREITLNILTPLYIIKTFLPYMIKNNYGRILNVGSVSGTMPSSFFSVYCSTKAFINTFSQALNGELKDTNVICSCLLPGRTNTNFYKSMGIDTTKYADPKKVAEYGIKLMEQGKDYGVYGFKNKVKQQIKRFIPRKILNTLLRNHCKKYVQTN